MDPRRHGPHPWREGQRDGQFFPQHAERDGTSGRVGAQPPQSRPHVPAPDGCTYTGHQVQVVAHSRCGGVRNRKRQCGPRPPRHAAVVAADDGRDRAGRQHAGLRLLESADQAHQAAGGWRRSRRVYHGGESYHGGVQARQLGAHRDAAKIRPRRATLRKDGSSGMWLPLRGRAWGRRGARVAALRLTCVDTDTTPRMLRAQGYHDASVGGGSDRASQPGAMPMPRTVHASSATACTGRNSSLGGSMWLSSHAADAHWDKGAGATLNHGTVGVVGANTVVPIPSALFAPAVAGKVAKTTAMACQATKFAPTATRRGFATSIRSAQLMTASNRQMRNARSARPRQRREKETRLNSSIVCPSTSSPLPEIYTPRYKLCSCTDGFEESASLALRNARRISPPTLPLARSIL